MVDIEMGNSASGKASQLIVDTIFEISKILRNKGFDNIQIAKIVQTSTNLALYKIKDPIEMQMYKGVRSD